MTMTTAGIPDFLAKTVAYLQSGGAGAPRRGHRHRLVIRALSGWPVRRNPPPDACRCPAIRSRRRHLRRHNRFPPIAFLYERAAGEAIGNYRTDLPVLGDWDFNLRFAERFGIGVIPEALAYWHHRTKFGGLSRLYANSRYAPAAGRPDAAAARMGPDARPLALSAALAVLTSLTSRARSHPCADRIPPSACRPSSRSGSPGRRQRLRRLDHLVALGLQPLERGCAECRARPPARRCRRRRAAPSRAAWGSMP